jgi:signal transduction histidine kinase
MLAAINKELEEFVYIVSHDLKEPLFVIEGYTSRLYRAYKDIYDNKEKHYIERIRTNVKIMSQKIQEIMEVLKAGRIAYDFRKNDSGVIIREVINSLEGRIRAEKVNVIIEPNLPVVFCDERRMKDVFSNLVTNAIKFMGNDKQTEFPINPPRSQANTPRSQAQLGNEQMGEGGFKKIRIGCHTNGDYYKFFVEDTGIGIREEYQEQIFKIFKRLKDIEAEGTGVGLAIVKKIVELHGGKLWVESPVKDGRGSRFCFTIPLEKKTSGQHDMQGEVDLHLGVTPGTGGEIAHGVVSSPVACHLSPVA